MRRIRFSGIYEWGILAVLFLIVLHAPFSVAAGSLLPDYATVLKTWKEIALAILSIAAVLLLIRHGLWQVVLRSWIIRLTLAFIALHLLLAITIGGDLKSIIAGLMIDLRFIAMFQLAYILVLIRPAAIRRVVAVVAAGAAVVIGFGLLQITVLPDGTLRSIGYSGDTITPYTTIDSNPEYVRINSTLRGPNPLGAITVLYAALAFSYLYIRRQSGRRNRIIIAVSSLVGSIAVLFASYSRSAYIALIGTLGTLLLIGKRLSRRLVLIGLTGSVIIAGTLVLVSSTDWYSNVVLHEDPESTVVTKSNQGHIESFLLGAERMVRQPVGAGIGSTGSASLYDTDDANDTTIENYYFFVAHESGWLGLLLFTTLYGMILIRLWQRRSGWVAAAMFASGIGLAIIGILLPVWADETVALIWWGLSGALLAQSGIIEGGYGRRTRQ